MSTFERRWWIGNLAVTLLEMMEDDARADIPAESLERRHWPHVYQGA